MRRCVLLLVSTALAVLLASGVALAEEKLDQENAGPIRTYSDREEFDGDEQHLAQVFTAGKTGNLSKISLRIEKAACGANVSSDAYKDVPVRLYRLDSWNNNWIQVASATIPASQVPHQPVCGYWYTPQWTDATFDPDNRWRVYAGYKYRITLEPEPDQRSSYYWYHSGNSYSDGDGYYRYVDIPGHGWGSWNLDFQFKTYVDVPDTDGDGLANDVDQCDNDPGPASNNGCPIDTMAPTGNVAIEGGADRINFRNVTLTLDAGDPSPGTGVASMRLKNAGGNWTKWQLYATSKNWKLTRGAGKKTVYVRYKDGAGNVSVKVSDSITYRP